MPSTERSAYEFVSQAANISAPATRATRFLEALGFMGGECGFDFEAILASRGLSGFWRSASRPPSSEKAKPDPAIVGRASFGTPFGGRRLCRR